MTDLEELNLAGNQFGGQILSSVQSLQKLETIDLTGNIPIELGTLQNLRVIHLSNNVFTRDVPDYASGGGCQDLQWLDLSSNGLSGAIPPNLSSCLSNNYLIGTIPASLGNAPQARILRLNGNSLNGSLPGELGNATSLVDF